MQWSTSKKKGGGKRRTKASLRLRRAKAQLKLIQEGPAQLGQPAEVLAATLLLHEVTETTLALFSTKQLGLDQQLAISLDAHRKFFVNARVDYCAQILPNSGVMTTAEKYPYRIKVTLLLDSDEQRADVKKFVEEIRATCLPGLPPTGDSTPAAA